MIEKKKKKKKNSRRALPLIRNRAESLFKLDSVKFLTPFEL